MRQFDIIKVITLRPEEIQDLTVDDLIYVRDSDFKDTVLVRAHILGKRTRDSEVEIKDIYGSTRWWSFDDCVYAEHQDGDELPLMRTAGARLSSTLFFPGMEEEEAQERLYKAIRSEFGAGVVQAWSTRTGPVRNLRWNVYAVKRDWVAVQPKDKRKKATSTTTVETSRRPLAQGVWDGHDNHFGHLLEIGEQLHIEPYTEPAEQAGRTI
jgi:hypothetical protein